MEQNMPVVAKKVWNLVRVAFFVLRKGLSKRKLLMDLNMMKHRSKIAGKAFIGHLMFHHHHHQAAAAADATHSHGGSHLPYPIDGREYEFSCSSTPLHRHYLPKKKNHRRQEQTTLNDYEDFGGSINFEAVCRALEMTASDDVAGASPALPGLGFGRSPMPVRQLRITDSPYPLQNPDPEDNWIDHQAEKFIKAFYSQLNKQKS